VRVCWRGGARGGRGSGGGLYFGNLLVIAPAANAAMVIFAGGVDWRWIGLGHLDLEGEERHVQLTFQALHPRGGEER